MFEFSLPEMLLILVVTLLVVGPQRLPGLAREAGLWIGRIRRYVSHVQADIRREMEGTDVARDFGELHRELRAAGEQVREFASSASDFARKSIEEEPAEQAEAAPHAAEETPSIKAPADVPAEQPGAETPPAQPAVDIAATPAPDAGGEAPQPAPAAPKPAAGQRIVPPAG